MSSELGLHSNQLVGKARKSSCGKKSRTSSWSRHESSYQVLITTNHRGTDSWAWWSILRSVWWQRAASWVFRLDWKLWVHPVEQLHNAVHELLQGQRSLEVRQPWRRQHDAAASGSFTSWRRRLVINFWSQRLMVWCQTGVWDQLGEERTKTEPTSTNKPAT